MNQFAKFFGLLKIYSVSYLLIFVFYNKFI